MNDENQTADSVENDIQTLYDRLEQLSYYELLQIQQNADENQIRQAFRKLIAIYHPDRYAGELTPELHDQLVTIFDEIKKAYDTLSDRAKRNEYDSRLRGSKVSTGRIDKTAQMAETQYNSGLQALKDNEVQRAIEFFKSAIEMNPDNPEYYAKLAMAQMSSPRLRKEAIETAQKALKINPENANYYALIGRIYQKMDMLDQAETYYNRALGWEPRHKLARQELANIKVILDAQRLTKWDKIVNSVLGIFKRKPKDDAGEPKKSGKSSKTNEKSGDQGANRERPQRGQRPPRKTS